MPYVVDDRTLAQLRWSLHVLSTGVPRIGWDRACWQRTEVLMREALARIEAHPLAPSDGGDGEGGAKSG